ncbi:hypothetical protein K488DRAFT_89200 [Vararia minispora EC-137]|uniref:Uncharacterized protein n=1 Tax=Vararia minispora EC-137 TaxID=1314806 RepID=A0ACB8QBA8_9AGAM|nr:hypothetical protein K488DRAFT_89200 [Vararia minispora EC-137]
MRAQVKEDLNKIKAVEAETKDRLAETNVRVEQIERELATSQETVTQTAKKKEELEGDIMKLEGIIVELEVKVLEALMDAKKKNDKLRCTALDIAAKAAQDKLYHAAVEEMKTKIEKELDRTAAEEITKFAGDEQHFHNAHRRFKASIQEHMEYLARLEERVKNVKEMTNSLNRTKDQLSSTIAKLVAKIATGTQEVKNTEEAVTVAHQKKNELDCSAEKMEIKLEESTQHLAILDQATMEAQQKKE